MKRWEKITGIILTVLLLIAILISLLPQIFQRRLSGLVNEELNQNVYAHVSFDKIGLSVFTSFPKISLGVKDLTVTGKGAFAGDTLFFCHKNIITLDIKELVKNGNIIVKKAVFRSPVINLIIDKQGNENYRILTLQENNGTNDSTAKGRIKIEKLEISDATVKFDDFSAKTHLKATGLYLDFRGEFDSDKAKLSPSLFVRDLNITTDKINILRQTSIKVDGQIDADFNLKLLKTQGINITLNELDLQLKGFARLAKTGLFVNATLAAPSTSFKELLSIIPGIYKHNFDKIKADADISLLTRIKGFVAPPKMPSVSAWLTISDGWFKYTDLPKTVRNINFDLQYTSWEGKSHKIFIRNFGLSVDENFFKGNLDIDLKEDYFDIEGYIDSYFDLGEIRNFYHINGLTIDGPVELKLEINGEADYNAKDLSNIAVEGILRSNDLMYKQKYVLPVKIDTIDLYFQNNTIRINTLDGYYGKSKVKLHGYLDNYLDYILYGKKLYSYFKLKSRFVDLDEIINYPYGQDYANTVTNEKQSSQEDEGIIFLPGNLDFVIYFENDSTKWDFLPATNLKSKVRFKDGHLLVDYLYADILEAKGFGQMDMYANQNDSIIIDGELKIDNIELQSIYKTLGIYKDLTPLLQSTQGKVSFDVFGTLAFSQDYELDYRRMNLSGTVKSDSISMEKSDFFVRLAKIVGYKELSDPKLEQIDMRIKMDKGNLIIPNNYFTISGYKASLEGFTNLDGFINYRLGLELPGNIAGKLLNKISGKGKTVFVYVSVYGDVDYPRIKIGSNILGKTPGDTTARAMLDKMHEDSIMAAAHRKHIHDLDNAKKQAQDIVDKSNKEVEIILLNAQKKVEQLMEEQTDPLKKAIIKRKINRILRQSAKQARKIKNSADKKAKQILKNARKKTNKEIKKARKENKKHK